MDVNSHRSRYLGVVASSLDKAVDGLILAKEGTDTTPDKTALHSAGCKRPRVSVTGGRKQAEETRQMGVSRICPQTKQSGKKKGEYIALRQQSAKRAFLQSPGHFEREAGVSKGLGDRPMGDTSLFPKWACLHEACRDKMDARPFNVRNLPHYLHIV